MVEMHPAGTVPATVRAAGALVSLQGAASVMVALWLVVRTIAGHEDSVASGWGTAAWFGVLGSGVLAAGLALLTGRRWGRAPSIVVQILLVPVAGSLLFGSHQPLLGSILAVIVIGALVLLLSPPTTRWMELDEVAEFDDGAAGGSGSPPSRVRRP